MTTSHSLTYSERADRFAGILDRVGDRWDSPTPCPGWSVADVAEHVLATQRDFLSRHNLDAGAPPVGEDLALRWRDHAATVVAVLDEEGVADREYDGYFGRTTLGETMVDFYGWDMVIHGWDVARATEQEWGLADAEAEDLARIADGWGDALYSEGVCAPAVAVPAGASASDRLLARLGRDPAWLPAG